jgi:hypothetical protein
MAFAEVNVKIRRLSRRALRPFVLNFRRRYHDRNARHSLRLMTPPRTSLLAHQ